jgi:hypothetical protein
MARATVQYQITAEDKATKTLNTIKKSFGGVGNAAAGLKTQLAALVGVGGLGALIKSTMDATREATAYAKALNISVTSMQKFQYAARTVNIQGGKMSDILKDISEKIGDAFATGGGEAADVMERLGLNVKYINSLAPDAQLFAIAEALNAVQTQGEKVQIMEALASDASLLLPLLEDNAKGLRALGDEAVRTGNALSEKQNAAIMQADKAMLRLTGAVSGLANMLVVHLAPAITFIADNLKNVLEPTLEFISKAFNGVRFVILRTVVAIVGSFAKLTEVMSSAAAFVGLDTLAEKLDTVSKSATFMRESLNATADDFYKKIVGDGPGGLAPILGTGSPISAKAGVYAGLDIKEDPEIVYGLQLKDELVRLENQKQYEIWWIRANSQKSYSKFLAQTTKAQTTQVVGELVNMTQGVAQQNKAMFNINKVAGIANAVINTYQGVTNALAAYPPPLSFAMAAAQMAAGMAQVSAIKATSFGGGGGAPSLAGSGGAVPTIAVDQQGATVEQTTPNTNVEINISGGIHDSNSVRDLIEAINEEVGDGVNLVANIY